MNIVICFSYVKLFKNINVFCWYEKWLLLMIMFVMKVVKKLLLFIFVVRLKVSILNNIINIGYKFMVINVICLNNYIVMLLISLLISVFSFIWLVNKVNNLRGLVVLFCIRVIKFMVRKIVIGLFEVFFNFSVVLILVGIVMFVLCSIENIVVVLVDFIMVFSRSFIYKGKFRMYIVVNLVIVVVLIMFKVVSSVVGF